MKQKIENRLHLKKDVNKNVSFVILGSNAYKAEYAYKYAKEKGFTHKESLFLIAQLHQENGTWNEKRKGDQGCSVGIIQWNECARGKIPAKDWQGQVRIFVDEIMRKYEICGNFRQAQVAWNNPSVLNSGSYMTRYYYTTERVYKNLFG